MKENEPQHSQWTGRTAGVPFMHRWLIKSCRVLPLWFIYLGVAVFVIPMYMLLSHAGYISIYHYFRKRWKYNPIKSFFYVYKNHFKFAQIIIDRFYAYAGGSFHFDIENYDLYSHLEQQEGSFMIISSHIGNYELAGYRLRAEHKRFNALVYAGEAETVMHNREIKLSSNNIRMIAVKNDMSHLFTLSNALADGEVVSIPGDRLFGSPRSVECDFLGAKAKFPQGPFTLAVQRDVPVLAVSVMKVGVKKYHINVTRLPQAPSTESRKERVQQLAQSFATYVEGILAKHPEQWFNYFEFWDQ